jgi:hypothetical protein
MTPLVLIGFAAAGALIFTLGGLAAAALIWRFQGRDGALLKSEPAAMKLEDMPTETE